MVLSNDTRISRSRILKKNADILCSISVTSTTQGKKGEASICVNSERQVNFFRYRSLLLHSGIPVHWIIPVHYQNNLWRTGEPFVLTEEKGVQTKEVPELSENNQRNLDIIVDTLSQRLPDIQFNERKINPSSKSQMRKYFSQRYINSIRLRYHRQSVRLKPIFDPKEYKKP